MDPITFILIAFMSLASVVNPLSITPVFVAMTRDLEDSEVRAIATKSVVTAFLVLLLFALTGSLLFKFFSISVHSLRIVGGMLFLVMGYDMLQARISRVKRRNPEMPDPVGEDDETDIAITPIGIPLIAGPGAITAVVLMMQDAKSILLKVALLGVVVLVMFLVWLALAKGRTLLGFLGKNGTNVMVRLTGLIVMVMAVEFFFAGLKPILRNILKL